ncbi:transcriptional regulator [Rhodococcus aerolatus]
MPGRTVPGRGVDPLGQTRDAVARTLLEHGPVSAADVAERLGVSPAGVRRHLEALVDAAEATSAPTPVRRDRGRGRPARRYLLTAAGRSRFGHAYDDLAVDALRQLRELGGDDAVRAFARRRVDTVTAPARAAGTDQREVARTLAGALTGAGYAASVRDVGSGVELCQHHCPVAHVAAEFPEFCEAEREVFAELLGTHVQRLATIANGDPVCTTHAPGPTQTSPTQTSPAQTRTTTTDLRKELA